MQDVMNIYEDYAAWKKENFNAVAIMRTKALQYPPFRIPFR